MRAGGVSLRPAEDAVAESNVMAMDPAKLFDQAVKRVEKMRKAQDKVAKASLDLRAAQQELVQASIVSPPPAQKPFKPAPPAPAPGPITRAIRAAVPKPSHVWPTFKTYLAARPGRS
jgi:hypothetical protein